MNQTKHRILTNQKGFTLIEIIAVLVILGILAAVAVPKYISLQDDARTQAAMQAVAEGGARVSMAAAAHILQHGVIPTNLDDLITTTPVTGNALITATFTTGDYDITLTDGAAGYINISAQDTNGGSPAAKDYPLPI